MSSHNVGQVLGATAAVGGAIASLPATGRNPFAVSLVILSGVVGFVVLASFAVTRILKRVL